MPNSWSKKNFWWRVNSQTVEKENGCLEFTGCKDDCGYGRINNGHGKLVRLHRAVWERDHGAPPKGMVVMHLCDNRACIRPSHLVLGTQAQNIADMDLKGRRRTLRGSEHGMSKLSEMDIPVIRRKLSSGQTQASIAKEYGVTEGMIAHIAHGRSWSHIK